MNNYGMEKYPTVWVNLLHWNTMSCHVKSLFCLLIQGITGHLLFWVSLIHSLFGSSSTNCDRIGKLSMEYHNCVPIFINNCLGQFNSSKRYLPWKGHLPSKNAYQWNVSIKHKPGCFIEQVKIRYIIIIVVIIIVFIIIIIYCFIIIFNELKITKDVLSR